MELAMAMVFQTTQATPLYSNDWTPRSAGTYAGTCIFLIVLAVMFRALLATKSMLEHRWAAAAMSRRYVVVAGQLPAAERIQMDPNASTGTLVSANGVEEKVRVVASLKGQTAPWRFSVDLPRALLVMVTAGVGYLLMLAVMTMNVGYFMSVLAGVFVGDVVLGRYNHFNEH
ncbi:hypothetical protein PAAG_04492 [Paracoccidioides lutzii Pb01]|uniref:Copper transport protein n=1 Tax=Paracoccidioides lutzii (strain ATCC MYA-826 / Pb01) TaxID=502779 RepID=C1H148_PARBA|nr:hypothetical protein PAAG_04492 [Paracoccidioides lutzii Pb01]EEH33442.2 hypothetical protein PAAG_04492 [Paracoccidioides lutzii Pb01]